MKRPRPAISIITSTKNCAESLRTTVQSIREQRFPNLQWIVADGASTDGTIDVIRASHDVITDWFSTHDTGVYDAWNKACPLLRGEWVIFMGAGDTFATSASLERAVCALQGLADSVVLAYGNLIQTVNGRAYRRSGPLDLSTWELYRPTLPYHQSVFQRSRLLSRPIPFDATYRIAADCKFLIESLKLGDAVYLDIDVCIMESGGLSENPKHAVAVMREFFRIERELGYRLPIGNKAAFSLLACSKYILYRFGGPRLVETVSSIKRRAGLLLTKASV